MDYPELLKGYKNELIKLQDVLVKERENRETDEVNAIELLTKVKEQYDLRFKQIKDEYEAKLSKLEHQVDELNEQLHATKATDDLKATDTNRETATKRTMSNDDLNATDTIRETATKRTVSNDDLNATDTKRETVSKRTVSSDHLESKLIELEDCRRRLEEIEISLNHKENEISNLKLDLRMAQREQARNQDHTKFLRESNRELKEKVASLENELKAHEFKDTSIESEMNSLKGVYEECKKKNERLQERLRSFEEDKQILTDEINNLKCSMKSKDEAIAKHRSTNLKLRSVLESVELQNDKLQVALDDEILNKGKRIEELEHKLENEIENNSNYIKEINKLQRECFDKETEVQQNDEKLSELIQALNVIKEERSHNLTISEELKKQNYKIAKMYDDLSQKYTLAKTRITSLLEENDLKVSTFEKERIKYQETTGQQTKLIDLLQERLKKAENTKKSWFSVGKSETDCKSPATFTPTTKKKKEEQELESALQREKHKNRILMQKINELERCQNNKRKNDHVDDNKKMIKTATAPSITEDETTSIKSDDLRSDQAHFKTNKRASIAEEEEFTFTDSIMEELAYKDD